MISLKILYCEYLAVLFFTLFTLESFSQNAGELVLRKSDFKHYIDNFNLQDTLDLHFNAVPGTQMISNADTWDFLEANIPFFECPDKDIQEVYYYRWWTFRKHLKQTPDGFIFTEFLIPENWAGLYNAISSAIGQRS